MSVPPSPMDPIKLGRLVLDPPVVLAPLAGISGWPMRLLCRRHGAALAYTEMIPAAAIVRGKMQGDVILALKTHPADRPLAYQLFGPDPEEMARAAAELGSFEADLIDLNMGCPVRKVVRSGSGCALMQDLPRARRMVAAVRAVVTVPLTVKMRLGWDEGSKNAVELARICEGEGADAITVHARTRAKVFTGPPDLDALAKVVQAVKLPVIGNGGIMAAADARRMWDATGCAGLMVARGAMGAPWVFAEIIEGEDSRRARPSLRERGLVAHEHFRMMGTYLVERLAVREMRKHLAWYSKRIPTAVELRRRLHQLSSAAELESLINQFFFLAE